MITNTTGYPAIRDNIISWLSTYSGVSSVMWANQNMPRAVKPYGSVILINSSVKIGFDETRESFDIPNQLIQKKVTGIRQLTAQIEFYSDPATAPGQLEASDMLEFALLALETDPVKDLFRAAKIGVLSQTPIQRLDEQFGDRWERRAQTDVVFTYSGETFDDGGSGSGDWIETVDLPTEDNGNATYGT